MPDANAFARRVQFTSGSSIRAHRLLPSRLVTCDASPFAIDAQGVVALRSFALIAGGSASMSFLQRFFRVRFVKLFSVSLPFVGFTVLSAQAAWSETDQNDETAIVASASPPATPPVIIRVSEDLFNSGSEIESTSDVDSCILGIRNLGEADVIANTSIEFVPASDAAHLKIRFRGHFTADTRGRKGPAIIQSQSTMRFDLHMSATFDREDGFVAGDPDGDVIPTESRRTVSSTLPGLRGRIVKNVARRRMAETKHQVEQICIANAREQLIVEMERRVKKQLEQANQRLVNLKARLKEQPWYDEVPTLNFTSEEGYLVIQVIGSDVDPDSIDFQLPSDLPAPNSGAMSELLLARTWVDEKDDSNALLDYAASYPSLVNLTLQAATKFALPYQQHDNWLVFALHKDERDSEENERRTFFVNRNQRGE